MLEDTFDEDAMLCKGRYVFNWGGRVGLGALEGRVISKYFTNWRGSNLFDTQPGKRHSFFLKENITPYRYVSSRQPLDYQKSRKSTCDLLLSKPRELPTGAFFQSQNSRESVPSKDT